MKSQLMTALSIVGVLGTATTAMAVNTDVLASLDAETIGTATDTLLPNPSVENVPAPGAVPANPAAPVDPAAPALPGGTVVGGTVPAPAVQGGTPVQAPAVQSPQAAVVDGISGGSGSREYEEDDEDGDDEDEDENEDEDDD
jgi:hypothetical protein